MNPKSHSKTSPKKAHQTQLKGLHISDLGKGRRELTIKVGSFNVTVLEIAAADLTEEDWNIIQEARRSYTHMWGWKDALADDPKDGRGNSIYDTKHYIASVTDSDDDSVKTVTMRKVRINPSKLTEDQLANPFPILFSDIKFWKVQEKDGTYTPLWKYVVEFAKKASPDEKYPEYRISSNSRVGTFPFAEPEITAKKRDRTAIAFAAIQVLSNHQNDDLAHTCYLCAEFQDKVLGIVDINGVYVPPDYTTTEKVLGLPENSVMFDKSLYPVRNHIIDELPGYLIDNDSASQFLSELFEQKLINIEDFASTFELIFNEASAGRHKKTVAELNDLGITKDLTTFPKDIDYVRLSKILTSSTNFKFLKPRLSSDEPLANISGKEFRDRLIDETKDGPFSSILIPQAWDESARKILLTAQNKYN